jgi:hypothetical protein
VQEKVRKPLTAVMEHHRRVFIYRNEAVALGELLIYDPSISLETLKSLAGQKLGLNPARRVFLVSGAEVKGESELQNGDNLYFSAGEPFYRISTNTNEKIDVAILGAGGVGKSALALRYLRDTFVQHYDATIQVCTPSLSFLPSFTPSLPLSLPPSLPTNTGRIPKDGTLRRRHQRAGHPGHGWPGGLREHAQSVDDG